MKDYKLSIELVPETVWYKNLRKLAKRSVWDKLRKEVYAEYDHKCGICDATGQLNCHEIWEYDDENHTQRLTGFIALCSLCHHVKHIGLANILAKQGKLDFSQIVEHFVTVNECTMDEFEQYVSEVFAQWKERSQHDWSTDFGKYKSIFSSAE